MTSFDNGVRKLPLLIECASADDKSNTADQGSQVDKQEFREQREANEQIRVNKYCHAIYRSTNLEQFPYREHRFFPNSCGVVKTHPSDVLEVVVLVQPDRV